MPVPPGVARVFGIARKELQPYLWVLVVLAGVVVFFQIADGIHEGEIRRVDDRILLALRHRENLADALGPPWVEGSVRDLTALGSTVVLVMVILSFAAWLGLRGQRHAMVLVLVSAGTGVTIGQWMKALFGRPRPEIVPHLTPVNSLSFPSGHAMMSAVVYLTLCVVATRMVKERLIKAYFLGLGLFLTFVVGFSRVYLGVHYPSDVVAGWIAGLVWATLTWAAATRLQQEGTVEKPK